jgi:hypothetical protein
MSAAVASTGRRAAGGVTATVLVVVAIAAGVGWLYLLRTTRALDAGPTFTDALPLQRLAGQGTQPLLRLAVAWVPAGLVAGIALGALTSLRRIARAIVAGVVAFVVLFAAGAGSDSVTASDPLSPHIAPQLHRAALWTAVALVVCGALLAPVRRRRA